MPSTTIQSISDQTGRWSPARFPSSDTLSSTRLSREAPPRREDRPEERREEEAPGGERDRVSPLDAALREQDVGGVRDRREAGGGDARAAQPAAVPDLHDQGQACKCESECGPDALPDGLVVDEARPECDEDRADELDQQGDPDLEPVDREEVRPLHEREPADAEREQQRQVLDPDAQCPPAGSRV